MTPVSMRPFAFAACLPTGHALRCRLNKHLRLVRQILQATRSNGLLHLLRRFGTTGRFTRDAAAKTGRQTSGQAGHSPGHQLRM